MAFWRSFSMRSSWPWRSISSPAPQPRLNLCPYPPSGKRFLDRAGDEIDRQGQDDRIEKERQNAMPESQPAHMATGHLHVGDLAGHADDEGVIEKIPEIRILLVGKFEAAAILF